MKSAFSGPVTGAAPRTVYLDHAATTPMLPAAVEAMTAAMTRPGNASSVHGSGRAARRLLEEARESIAESLGARPSEVIFTSGGTESDNLAVKGIYWARRDADPRRTRIIASSVEHHAVIDAIEWLERHEGARATWLPVDAEGMVSPATLREALAAHSDEVALVTIMWANNEVGAIQPIRELATVAQEFGVPMHSDAIQAAAQLPIDFAASGLSAASFAGHKVGGPHGAGVLLLGRQVEVVPLLHGGGHERDLRSGTSDTPAAVGLATALRITAAELPIRTPNSPRCATRSWTACSPRSPTPCSTARSTSAACPATRISRSRAARATRCSCCWTPPASNAPPARPATRAWRARATC